MSKIARRQTERRGFQRWPSGEDGSVKFKGADHPCKIVDISASGVRIAADIRAGVGDELTLALRGLAPFRVRVVRVEPGAFAAVFVEGPHYIFR
jgi:hypothetical protein